MPLTFRDGLGYWLEKFHCLDRLILRYDRPSPYGGKLYVNRINGHSIVRDPRWSK